MLRSTRNIIIELTTEWIMVVHVSFIFPYSPTVDLVKLSNVNHQNKYIFYKLLKNADILFHNRGIVNASN